MFQVMPPCTAINRNQWSVINGHVDIVVDT